MSECLFSDFCTESLCDRACPNLVESSYLLERNGLKADSAVRSSSQADVDNALSQLEKSENEFKVIVSDNTAATANLLTYCAICKYWQGNRLHCNVYHLRFSNHIDSLQRSWGLKEVPEALEYEQIWIASAKLLIISNIDFVKFQDFQSQTLLNIIHSRMVNGLTTIVVSPKIQTLVGSGMFFSRIKEMFGKAVLS